MKQVFLDTNVIIDYLGNRTGFYDDAAIIMSLAINQKIKLYAAAISFATASYILSKNNDNNRIKTLIADFCNICKVVATDEECVNYATISDFEDFEDAMQYKCAEKAKADGRFKEALDYLEEAAKISPENENVKKMLPQVKAVMK